MNLCADCFLYPATKRGLSNKNLAARFNICQPTSVGLCIKRAASLEGYCNSGRSTARYANLMQALRYFVLSATGISGPSIQLPVTLKPGKETPLAFRSPTPSCLQKISACLWPHLIPPRSSPLQLILVMGRAQRKAMIPWFSKNCW